MDFSFLTIHPFIFVRGCEHYYKSIFRYELQVVFFSTILTGSVYIQKVQHVHKLFFYVDDDDDDKLEHFFIFYFS